MLLPSMIWFYFTRLYSPWWLENLFSTPLILIVILILLLLIFSVFIPIQKMILCGVFNILAVILINNSFMKETSVCSNPIAFFQFNIKYNEENLKDLADYLISKPYQLIAIQEISPKAKSKLIAVLAPYFPYFINGIDTKNKFNNDQLILSVHPFTNVKYYTNQQSSFITKSHWQHPSRKVNLLTLHPPSPRNKALWERRNKTLYQLKYALTTSALDFSIVIGDLNLSQHSIRLEDLMKGMDTSFVNSWPNKDYLPIFLGLSIDHFWLSDEARICERKHIKKLDWSDHYAIKTTIDFTK